MTTVKAKGPKAGAVKRIAERFSKLKRQKPSEELVRSIKEVTDEYERQQNEENTNLPKIDRVARERDSEV